MQLTDSLDKNCLLKLNRLHNVYVQRLLIIWENLGNPLQLLLFERGEKKCGNNLPKKVTLASHSRLMHRYLFGGDIG